MVERSSFDKGRDKSSPYIGAQLGNYRLEQLLEPGNVVAPLAGARPPSSVGMDMGSVFLARANTGGTSAIIRLLTAAGDLAPEARIVYLGRFQQEANSVAELQHPHILPLLDYGNYQSMPYLVFPYVPMTSLSTQLAKHGPLDAITAGRYLDQIAAALEYAHQHAILHRNLTTDCIFLRQDGSLIVADFGVLRMLDTGASTLQEGQGYIGEAYAPEQLLGQPVDTYTDVYALGAVLYRLLTGHRVFGGKTREEIVQQHLQTPVPPLVGARFIAPTADLDRIIRTAMAKNPAQRFRQPGELANAYSKIVVPNDTTRTPFVIASVPTVEAQQTPAPVRPSPPARRVRSGQTLVSRRRALVLLASGGGVAAVAVVALLGSRLLAGSNTTAGGSTPGASSNPQATNPPAQGGGTVIAQTSDVPLNSAKTFTIPHSSSKNPGVLIHLSDNRFVAFDSTCTHTGCPVNYNSGDKLLECPCHGASFDPAKNAVVVGGPAPTPLTPVKITVNTDGSITTG